MITERVAAPERRKKSFAVPLPRRWLVGGRVAIVLEGGGTGGVAAAVVPAATSERCSPKLFPRNKPVPSLRRRVAPGFNGWLFAGRLNSNFEGDGDGKVGAPAASGEAVCSSMLPESCLLSRCDPEGPANSNPIIGSELLLVLLLWSIGVTDRNLDTASAKAFLSAMIVYPGGSCPTIDALPRALPVFAGGVFNENADGGTGGDCRAERSLVVLLLPRPLLLSVLPTSSVVGLPRLWVLAAFKIMPTRTPDTSAWLPRCTSCTY